MTGIITAKRHENNYDKHDAGHIELKTTLIY